MCEVFEVVWVSGWGCAYGCEGVRWGMRDCAGVGGLSGLVLCGRWLWGIGMCFVCSLWFRGEGWRRFICDLGFDFCFR